MTFVPFAISFVLRVIFFVRRCAPPQTTALIDLRLFKHRYGGARRSSRICSPELRAASARNFSAALLPTSARADGEIGAGLLLAPQGIGMLLTLPQVGRLTDRFDNGKIVIAGVVATVVGTYAFTQATDHSSYVLLSLSLVLRGAGLGATSTPALAAAYKPLARDEIPNATTALNIVQRLGAPLGTAMMAVTLQRFIEVDTNRAHAFAHTFTVSAALSALALFAGLRLVNMNKGK